jgi:hypothetical protein
MDTIQGRGTVGCILVVAGLEECLVSMSHLPMLNLADAVLAETLDPVEDDRQSSHHPQETRSPSSCHLYYRQKWTKIPNRRRCRHLFPHTAMLDLTPHSRAQVVRGCAEDARSLAPQTRFAPNRATPYPSLTDFLPLLRLHESVVCRCSRRQEVDPVVWRVVVFGERFVRVIDSGRGIPCRFLGSVEVSKV